MPLALLLLGAGCVVVSFSLPLLLGGLDLLRRRSARRVLREVFACLEEPPRVSTYWLADPGRHTEVVCVVLDPTYEDELWAAVQRRLARGLHVRGGGDHLEVRERGVCHPGHWLASVEVHCYQRYHDLLVCH